MADKQTALSIVIRTVDQATAKIKAINDRIDKATKPARDFGKALSDLREKSGLNDVIGGFKNVGSAIEGVLTKVAVVGGIAGAATAAVFHLVGEFDDLGKKAQRLGVGADFLAEMRYAAEKTGVPLEALDSGLETFNQNLGQARANTGRMAKFLGIVSPALLRQLKGAKDNAAAFDLLAGAMAKITDPAKRAALAQKTFGDSALAPLFAKGAIGIKELRDRYLELAGSQEGAVEGSEQVADSMHDLHATTDGLKAAIVEGLAPALKVIVDRLRDWFQGHREDVRRWAAEIGEKLPAAVQSVVEWVQKAVQWVGDFVDRIGGLKTVAIAAAAVLAGPLIGSVLGLIGAVGKLALGADAVGLAFGPWAIGIAAAAFAISGVMDMIDELKGKLTTKNELALEDAARHPAAPGSVLLPGDVFDMRSLMPVESMSDQARSLFARPRSMLEQQPDEQKAKITVDFANAPRGMRVKTDPQSTADVDLSVGYNMLVTP